MLLGLRGWGPSDLDRVDPAFREAAHFGIYAERLAGLLRDADQILDMKLGDVAGAARGDLARAKAHALTQRKLIREALALDG